MRRCCVNFQCRGVLLIWIIVGQGPIALAVGAGGGCLDIFSLIYHFSFLSPSLWETARYRLKYCLKGPLSPKQPTNHQMMSLTFGLFSKVSGSGPLGPLVLETIRARAMKFGSCIHLEELRSILCSIWTLDLLFTVH